LWLYQQINEQINLEIMKRFEAEKIDFAYPSQTLYVKKDNPNLAESTLLSVVISCYQLSLLSH